VLNMDTASQNPDIESLKRFIPLQSLSAEQLERLAGLTRIHQAPAGHLLIERGSDDNFSYFLLDGKLKLVAQDGKENLIGAGEPSSHSAIAQLRPRRYEVTSLTPIRFLRIENELLEETRRGDEAPSFSGGIDGYSVSGDDGEETNEFEGRLSLQLLQDLESDQLELPSLPEVAVRIGQAMEDEISDAKAIAEMIQTDPVITAKLIKASNSAMYGRRTPVETCTAAVVRLGLDVTHKLVLSYALRELFRSESGLLQQRMQELWNHSTKVAALCYVLARKDSRFVPEQAMLIGLLHDIGVVAVLNYMRRFPFEAMQSEIIDQAVKNLRAQIGAMILQKWGFASEFVVAALESEKWMRNKGSAPDYCDLVIIAQLHSFIGTTNALNMPAINQVPAHHRLQLGELTPHMSLKLLEEAGEQIAHAESMLNL
jgi:HD-like signal output (HDOD) protein